LGKKCRDDVRGLDVTDEASGHGIVTPAEILAVSPGPGPVWTLTSDDLNVNLLSFTDGEGVASHVNNEVDVLVIVVAGEGLIEIDRTKQTIRAGQVCLIPKGALRAIRSGSPDFAYLTAHRRRGFLWPEEAPPPDSRLT
jgi:mannose-6-phosphate isomerase-like protein (cupin superfamily)